MFVIVVNGQAFVAGLADLGNGSQEVTTADDVSGAKQFSSEVAAVQFICDYADMGYGLGEDECEVAPASAFA